MFINQVKTKYKAVPVNYTFEESNIGPDASPEDMHKVLTTTKLNPWQFNSNKNATQINVKVRYEYDGIEKVPGTNMLGLIMFALASGSFLGRLGKTGQPMVNFFKVLLDVVMSLVTLVIW